MHIQNVFLLFAVNNYPPFNPIQTVLHLFLLLHTSLCQLIYSCTSQHLTTALHPFSHLQVDNFSSLIFLTFFQLLIYCSPYFSFLSNHSGLQSAFLLIFSSFTILLYKSSRLFIQFSTDQAVFQPPFLLTSRNSFPPSCYLSYCTF